MSTPRVFIIAEAGVNHNGSPDTAKALVRAASDAGADAVKFQTFKAEAIASQTARKASYQERTSRPDETQYAMLKKLELSVEVHQELMHLCDGLGIEFLSSAFDRDSADLLDELGVTQFKLGSGEITNLPLLVHVAAKRKPLILSTGMATLGEVEEAVEAITAAGNTRLTLLHCVTEYPAPVDEVNLNAMRTLKKAFGYPVGYSDHSDGSAVAIAAAALGAAVIEKHLTLKRGDPVPDHRASMEPDQFAAMVRAIRDVEMALGDGRKRPAPCELGNMIAARKSLVAACDIPAGTRLSQEMIAVKRPGSGIKPKYFDRVIGRTARRAIAADELIGWENLA